MKGRSDINRLQLPHSCTWTDVNETLREWKQDNLVIDMRSRSTTRCSFPKRAIIHLAHKYMYTFDKYKRGKDVHPKTIRVLHNREDHVAWDEIRKQTYIRFTRDLMNEPANIATPEYVARHAKTMFANSRHVTVDVWDEHKLATMGFNLVLAVGKASMHQPRVVKIEYTPPTYKKTICLCGKGVTFDAGGLNIKTGSANSFKMKGDKTGGCIVLGMMKYFADVGAPVKMVAMVPLVENIISGNVTRPGDIVRSYSGKTVEILDTDAEGRLILADVLSYCCREYTPDYLLDFATLTGWASRLHCDTSAVFFAADAKMHDAITKAGDAVGERTWGMPRWLDDMKWCTSVVADVKNFDFVNGGCKQGSGYMAAMFLAHFVPKMYLHRWVHFDITHNVTNHLMNANSMNLAIELIKALVK